jgi:putative transposase
MRGNNRRAIFDDDADRLMFLKVLAKAKVLHGWRVHAYCLMTNHYHLLLETPEPNIGVGMRWLNSVYSHRFNQRHSRVGHLFQRRYDDGYITETDHLREVVRYIPLNPVRAGLCRRPEQYRWSSYAATLGQAPREKFLTVRAVLDLFDANLDEARKGLRGWVEDGLERPRSNPRQSPLILLIPPGRSVTADVIRAARGEGHTLSAIGRHLGVSHTTVRRKMLSEA